MSAMASQITSLTIVYSTVFQCAEKWKHQKIRVTGLSAGNSPVTGDFRAQRASNVENVSILWRHHEHVRSHDMERLSALPTLWPCVRWILWTPVDSPTKDQLLVMQSCVAFFEVGKTNCWTNSGVHSDLRPREVNVMEAGAHPMVVMEVRLVLVKMWRLEPRLLPRRTRPTGIYWQNKEIEFESRTQEVHKGGSRIRS